MEGTNMFIVWGVVLYCVLSIFAALFFSQVIDHTIGINDDFNED